VNYLVQRSPGPESCKYAVEQVKIASPQSAATCVTVYDERAI
jgi:hypothetical protein